MARYEAGETLSSIARTYGCSPPAISYVVSRSRARQTSAAAPPAAASGSEPQLIKAPAAEPAIGGANPSSGGALSRIAPPVEVPASSTLAAGEHVPHGERPVFPQPAAGEHHGGPRPRDTAWPAGNGASGRGGASPMPPLQAPPLPHRPTGPQMPAGSGNGDARRTLHLSLGTASPGSDAAPPTADDDQAASQHTQPHAGSARDPWSTSREPAHNGGGEAGFRENGPIAHPVPPRSGNGTGRNNGGGVFIDEELRARVEGDIAAFLAAFDAALGHDTQENRSLLREATDRLLRAGARTRIELERLEARVPLTPRDGGRRSEPAWRQR